MEEWKRERGQPPTHSCTLLRPLPAVTRLTALFYVCRKVSSDLAWPREPFRILLDSKEGGEERTASIHSSVLPSCVTIMLRLRHALGSRTIQYPLRNISKVETRLTHILLQYPHSSPQTLKRFTCLHVCLRYRRKKTEQRKRWGKQAGKMLAFSATAAPTPAPAPNDSKDDLEVISVEEGFVSGSSANPLQRKVGGVAFKRTITRRRRTPAVAAASSSSANEQLAANEHSVPEETEDMDMALKQALNQMEEEEE